MPSPNPHEFPQDGRRFHDLGVLAHAMSPHFDPIDPDCFNKREAYLDILPVVDDLARNGREIDEIKTLIVDAGDYLRSTREIPDYVPGGLSA